MCEIPSVNRRSAAGGTKVTSLNWINDLILERSSSADLYTLVFSFHFSVRTFGNSLLATGMPLVTIIWPFWIQNYLNNELCFLFDMFAANYWIRISNYLQNGGPPAPVRSAVHTDVGFCDVGLFCTATRKHWRQQCRSVLRRAEGECGKTVYGDGHRSQSTSLSLLFLLSFLDNTKTSQILFAILWNSSSACL